MRYRSNMTEAYRKVVEGKLKEDGHTDVPSMKRLCKTIKEDVNVIESKLNSMPSEESIDTWWTNKMAKSGDNINSCKDYIESSGRTKRRSWFIRGSWDAKIWSW